MSTTFHDHLQKTVECYVDDIAVKSHDKNDHLRDRNVLIEFLPAHKINNIRFRTSCARFSIRIRGSSGYAGRDPQGGTSDGSFVNKLSLKFLLI